MWLEGASGVFSEGRFRDRVRFASFFFAACYAVILLRLFYLQIVRGDDLAQMSESNRTQVLFLRAPRGDFYDRNGELLNANRPSWSVMYSLTEDNTMKRADVEEILKPFLDPISNNWRQRLRKAFQTKRMVRLVEDVPNDVAFGLSEMGDLSPGTRMEMEFRRGYTEGVTSSHLIGYLGEIGERELQHNDWDDRKMGDLIGKMGLERTMDDTLRGQDGGTVIEVDSTGRLKRVIRELPYSKGNSLYLTIDRKVQKAAEVGLAASPTGRGAAIVLDVHTGAVLAWVSAPSFNPGKLLAEDMTDKNLPLFDRVYRGAYPPGSVFKIITAAAGFEKNLIRTSARVYCEGFITLKDKQGLERKYKCWKAHGVVDYWRAMAESCDVYFYQLGQNVGSQGLYDMARQFGFGESAQKILPGENVGTIPNAIWKRRKGLGGWSTGDTVNMSIGQGFVTASPLQCAILMATLATRGPMVRPYVVQKVLDSMGEVSSVTPQQPSWKNVILKESTWNALYESLRLVVRQGTGGASHVSYLEVRGKTGTAQNPHGEDHAWFAAFAGYPHEPPAVALCIFVENGGHGGAVAANIAKDVLEAALPPKNQPVVQ